MSDQYAATARGIACRTCGEDRGHKPSCDAMTGHIAQALRSAVLAERERCIQICEDQRKAFGSTEYAADQPASSQGERFACTVIIDAIRGNGDG